MRILKTGDPKIPQILKEGKIGVLPTDTLYGVVACAANEAAVARLYRLKRRENKPGTIIAASTDQLLGLGVKKRYINAVEDFWPNSISVVVPTGSHLTYLHQGKGSLAVRVPSDKILCNLLKKTGPLITSSANQPGEEPAKNINQAVNYFNDAVDFYVEAGTIDSKPSTVIRVVDDAIEIIREGVVKIDEATGRMIP